MASGFFQALLILWVFFKIRSCFSENASDIEFLQERPIGVSLEKKSEDSSNQKQYVDWLNAKLLAQGGDRIEKNYASSSSFSHLDNHGHSKLYNEEYEDNPGKLVSSYLRRISNDELGITTMQEIYDSLPSFTVLEDSKEVVREIAQKLSKKFKDYLTVLNKNKILLEDISNQERYYLFDMKSPCCHIPIELLRYNEHFGTDITIEKGCETYLYSEFPDQFYAGSVMSPAFKYNLEKLPTLMWQYFISMGGTHFEYPAYHINPELKCKSISDRHGDVFQTTIYPTTKHVIIVIDQGYSLSSFQFDTAKAVAKHILSLLTPGDKVAVFGLAADVQYAHANSCSSQKMLHATSETKFLLSRFIEGLSRKLNITDHILGFTKAYEIVPRIERSNHSAHGEVLIAYISRGLLSSLIDAKKVLEIIADGNRNTKNHIVINTYAIIDDEKPVMYEKAFLKDVAEQNFKNYNVHFRSKQEVKKGLMIPINSTDELTSSIGNIFSAFPHHLVKTPVFLLPYWDSVSKGMIISITEQVIHRDRLMGVVGVDVSLTDIAEDSLSYFSNTATKYIFLLDDNGIALMHPSFSHPPFANEHHIHTFIWHVEDKPGFQNIYEAILREPYGEEVLPYTLPNCSENICPKEKEKLVVYRWRKVEETPYIVCMMSIEPSKLRKVLKDSVIPEVTGFMYHRLDLLPAANVCRHMKQLSSLGVTALFLSASCFTSPYKYLVEEETKQMVQNYMAYLTDTTKLIANPGLKPGVRSEVLAASWITPTWEKVTHNNEFSNYIVRRFIATVSGVFQVYPATLIDKLYDATRRDWYIRAVEHPGKIILTAPYLDVGGAGYVITLSHTIYEGKPAAMHNSFDNIVAVMGMDFTFGYFYKLLLDKVPICKQEKIICFLLDDRGYLIAHPDLIEPSGRGPVEQQHITHKEPLVANDLLNHKEFVSKKVCNSFSDRTIQRFYQLNTSIDGVLANQVHGEQCTKYQVMAIQGTNIFLGIVNRTCDGITAFCPCSMTDRLCLNCHRMEPTECECPCECPLEMDLCSGQLIDEDNRYPTCSHFPEEPNLPLVDHILLESLQPCYEYHCTTRSELSDCFGILGCEWCQLESDGTTPLLNKFCTDQRKCFGGVLGARTPYADEIIEGMPAEQFLIFKSPVGPVAGGFMVFFLVMALAVYCYRNHVRRGMTSHHSSSVPDTNLRMTQLNNEPDEPEIYQEPVKPVAPACQLIPRAENIAVSPYRVHTNYRRPPGGDSDHGYSTMTPHEDSEHAPCFEPLLIGKDKYFVPASQQSISSCSRTSSPVSHNPQSVLPPVTYIMSPCRPKAEAVVPQWVTKKDPMQSLHPKTRLHGSYVLAQVQVHSENLD